MCHPCTSMMLDQKSGEGLKIHLLTPPSPPTAQLDHTAAALFGNTQRLEQEVIRYERSVQGINDQNIRKSSQGQKPNLNFHIVTRQWWILRHGKPRERDRIRQEEDNSKAPAVWSLTWPCLSQDLQDYVKPWHPGHSHSSWELSGKPHMHAWLINLAF